MYCGPVAGHSGACAQLAVRGPLTQYPHAVYYASQDIGDAEMALNDQIANWAFVDWMLNFREETILSTIKIRQAGFADCIDTHQSFRRQLGRLRDLRVIL
jgi:hypothetical protein